MTEPDLRFFLDTGNAVHYMQIERGTTALFIGSNGSTEMYEKLQSKYKLTNSALDKISTWPTSSQLPQFTSKQSFIEHIYQFRSNLVPWQEHVSLSEAIRFYTEGNAVMIGWVAESMKVFDGGSTWNSLVGYHMLILSKEQAGIERALGGVFYASGRVKLLTVMRVQYPKCTFSR